MRSTLRDAMTTLLLCGMMAGCTDLPGQGPGGDDDSAGDDGGDGSGGDGGDDGGYGDGGEITDPVEGEYETTTTFDGTSSPVLAGAVQGVLGILSNLAQNPADTLVGVLESANLPILDELLGLLDPLLLDDLNGFINDYVLNRLVQGIPLPQQINGLLGDLTGLLTQFDVVSQLDLGDLDPTGLTTANHALAGLAFNWEGDTILANTPELLDQVTAAHDVTCQVSMDGATGAIELADHAFDLPFSDFAVVALNQALAQSFGVADLRGALGQLFDCEGLAQDVASRCVLLLCVGHQEELQQFCEAGLDQVASEIEDRLSVLDYGSLSFQAGQAVLTEGEDGLIETIEGSWQTIIEVNGVEVPLAAPFLGRRVE